jgi:ferredoxin-nitrite reductase
MFIEGRIEAMNVQNGVAALTAGGFDPAQKEYLSGFMAGVAQRGFVPFVGRTASGAITSEPAPGIANEAAPALEPAGEQMVYGTPVSELSKPELWKLEQNGLDTWDRLLKLAEEDRFPDEKDTYYMRYHGLFYVAPAQNSFMLRCRIPAGQLTSHQLDGMADIAEQWGNGRVDITTRANLQIREIAPKHMVKVLLRLQEMGLTARGSGVDNIRNITASPTFGIDRSELIDTEPLAKAMHHYILNNRDMYGLPRKFNISFDGGGAIDTAADTNDIGFVAVRVKEGHAGIEPGVYFRVELCGITGHQQFAKDVGVLVKPKDCVAVGAAIVRAFTETGDRTNRKKARLKYVVDKMGYDAFMALAEKKLDFPLQRLPLDQCMPRPHALPHGHIGVYRQKQPRLNYVGVAIPVGWMSVKQTRRIAELARNYGSSEVRLTVWQNLIIPNVADGFVETLKRNLVRMGFHHEATSIAGGVVACTGNRGCKWAATDTKGHSMGLVKYLESKFELDHPINIHFTGCPNSCAQHFMGDIGLLGTKVGPDKAEGYHVYVGGGFGFDQGVGMEVFRGVSFESLKPTVEKMLRGYLRRREKNESFQTFARRHDLNTLQAIFSNDE